MYTDASKNVVVFKCATCHYDIEIVKKANALLRLKVLKNAKHRPCQFVKKIKFKNYVNQK